MPPTASNPLRRGYSVFQPTTKPTVKGPSTFTNVLIKRRLPARGVVSSNPKRVDRLLQHAQAHHLLENVKEHTSAGWGVSIWIGEYHSSTSDNSVEIFVAAIPMGAAGAGFALFEMYAAGAQAIIRYGSNDREVGYDNLRELVIVDRADNLIGLRIASGSDVATLQDEIAASYYLVDLLVKVADERGIPEARMVCHNVEDYHSFNFPQFFDNSDNIQAQISTLEDYSPGLRHCWDMETAALFWRAQQFGLHAATVLQNLMKKPGMSPYEDKHGKISLEMEDIIYRVVFDALLRFTPETACSADSEKAENSYSSTRLLRQNTSMDLIGVEDPLNASWKLSCR